ncbi:MAG: FkbM family methyltransferase [Clostridiales bacterium]|nr:FkbM family methyltransferase [Clostridiales bacterium]
MKLSINEKDVWNYIAESEKPAVIYGMGNGAEKIIDVLEKKGVRIADIFASDDFVRGHSFHGLKVLKYSDVCKKYNDFNVILAFATHLPDVLQRIKKINSEHKVFAPDVPVAGNGIFTGKYFEENKSKFESVFNKLADDKSREVFENVLKFKISGKVDYLYSSTEYNKDKIYADLLHLSDDEIIVDAGAYDGDTIREFITFTGGKYKHIHALEPDEKNFFKLKRSTSSMKGVSLYNTAAWSKKEILNFAKKSGRNSKLSSAGTPVNACDIDSLVSGKITMIKMDIEGAEMEALCGCENKIKEYSPKLYVCAYHRNEDMFAIPLKIWEMNPKYKIYFRHSPYIPAWESNFYCIAD